MGSQPPFSDWVEEVSNDPIVFDDEINVEARGNVWSFGVTSDQAETLVREDVVEFVLTVAAARERQILDRFGRTRPMVLYCWFSFQDGYLRIGLVSAHHGYLPFGATLDPTDDLGEIAGAFLADAYHDGIPIGEFKVVTEEDLAKEEVEEKPYVLKIWSTILPREDLA